MRNTTIFVALAVAALSGCAMNYPQTRDEFRQQLVASDSRFKFIDTYVTKRRFDDVVKSLKGNVAQCFDQNVTTTRSQGGMTTMNVTDEWRTTVEVINRNRAEVTTQMKMRGAFVPGKVPPGGLYMTAVDVERLTPATTKLSYYGSTSSGSKERWDLIKQWSDGKPTPCPK
jgi:hypothetical protein